MKKSLLTIFSIGFFLFLQPQLHAQPSNQTRINGQTTAAENFAGGCSYKWVNDHPSIGLPASGTGNIPAFTAINNGNIPITANITATPIPTSFAYIPYADGTRGGVAIIDVNTKMVTSILALSDEPTDAAVNHAGTIAYVSDHDNSNILVINTATNTISATIPLIAKPLLSILSPDDSKLFVCDFPYVTVINTSNNSVIVNKLGFDPADLAVSSDGTTLYVSTTGSNNDDLVYVVSTTTYNEMDTFNAGFNASGMALSPDGSKLYVPNNTSAISDIQVVDTKTMLITGTISTGQYPGKIVFSKDGSLGYVTSQNPSSISVVDIATNQITSTILIGGQPSGLALSTDGGELYAVNFALNEVQVISTVTNKITATITGLLFPISLGNFITPYVNCGGGTLKFAITVEPTPPPAIAVNIATGNIYACEGSASVSPAIQQITVSGSYLTGDITATSPAGFDISLNAEGIYSGSLTLVQSYGVVSNMVIYVGSSASAAAGNHLDSVKFSTPGGVDQPVAVSDMISAIPVVNTVAAQTLLNGQNTIPVNFSGTADTYSWINNTPGLGLPATGTGNIPAFTAINNTFGPVTATIAVTPLNNTGCDGAPVKFTITVNSTRIATLTATDIPNTFTPNGDGENDFWMIKNIEYFPISTVNIFNRWGQKLYSSTGYSNPWDGTYNGKELPSGTYYYIIDLKNGQKVIAGALYKVH